VRDLLRWLYVGRLTLTLGVWAAILVVDPVETLDPTRLATLMFFGSLIFTGLSFWYTHVLGREPGHNFLYLHVFFDVALVTAIVHILQDTTFVPTYILVITEGALLLPLPGGVLIGALASVFYFGDQVIFFCEPLSLAYTLQIGLFAVVALITGWLGDRLRRAGLELGEVESELQQLRLDTGDILENIGTGVMTVDSEGRLAYMNRAAEEILQLRSTEWEGAPVLSAIEGVSPGLASIVRRSLERREGATRFKGLARSEGREVTLGISTTVLEREQYAPSVTAIFQDITDLERLDLLNRRNERLEAVAELSASLAHEIKNPLASIRSSVEQISAGRLNAEDMELLRRLVLTESDRLSRLLSDFLDYSVVKLAKPERVDLAQVLRDGIALVRQHPDAEDGARISCEGVKEEMIVPGDQDLLHRLVFNLVLNAIQFAGDDGTVGVTLDDCSGRPAPAGLDVDKPVRVIVEDSGPGIPEEEVGRIFDPFYTTREGGSGLGLALVHRAVEAHGGALFVERAETGGARFIIYLPGAPAEDRVLEATP